MMRTFDAELRRLLSRRLLKVLFALVTLGFLIAGIVSFFTSSNEVGAFGFDDRFHLVRFLETAEEISGLFILLFIVVGATAIGAEWTNRNLTVSLTFEPRRGVLLASKLGAVLVVAFFGAIVLELIMLLCVMPAALLRGTTRGVNSEWWIDYLGTLLRAGFVAMFGATVGLAIATIGRNTSAALGAAFVYFAILENLIRAWKPQWSEWLVGDNMVIVASGEANSFDEPDHGPKAAAFVLLLYGAIIYFLSLTFFRNRDVA